MNHLQKQQSEVFYEKKVSLKISQNSQENTCAKPSFLETLTQVFSCEFCEIFNSTFFTENILVLLHLKVIK